MNLLLLEEHERVAGPRFRVDGSRARHVREVLRAAPGDTLRVGVLEGPVGTATLVAVGEGEVVLDAELDGAPPPRAPVDLVLAIPRPKMLARLLPQIAALGVDRLVLLRTWRVAKPYLTADVLEARVHRPLLLEGLAQGRRTRLPRVTVAPLFRPFVEDELPALAAGALRLVAHPGAPRSFAEVGLARDARVVLVVGPEGGLLPFEVELLGAAGFAAVSLGDATLRTDTACVAALAQLALVREITARASETPRSA